MSEQLNFFKIVIYYDLQKVFPCSFENGRIDHFTDLETKSATMNIFRKILFSFKSFVKAELS